MTCGAGAACATTGADSSTTASAAVSTATVSGSAATGATPLSASTTGASAAIVSWRNLGFAGDFRLNSLRGFSGGCFGYDRLFGGSRRRLGNRRGDHFCNGGFSDSNRSDSFSNGRLNLLFFLLLILRTDNRVTNTLYLTPFPGMHRLRSAASATGRVTLIAVTTTTLAADAQMTRRATERRGIPLASRDSLLSSWSPLLSTTAGGSTFASSVRGATASGWTAGTVSTT